MVFSLTKKIARRPLKILENIMKWDINRIWFFTKSNNNQIIIIIVIFGFIIFIVTIIPVILLVLYYMNETWPCFLAGGVRQVVCFARSIF